MKILSIYWGFSSSVSIYINGKVIVSISEERFTRLKNDDSFPQKSIDFCLKEANITVQELDFVAIASKEQFFHHQLNRVSKWKIEDYLKEQKEFWYKKIYDGNQEVQHHEIMKNLNDFSQYPKSYWKDNINNPETFPKDREQILADYLKIDVSKVFRIDHHKAHAYYSYYTSQFRKEKVLAFTIDGHGDGLNATIGIFDEVGNYKRVFETNQANIGRIYRYMTLLLGMKPNEHEFKVMGLAPYGKEKYAKKAYEIFANTIYIDGLEFKWKEKPKDSYFYFKEKLEGIRFDNIAWGLQTWVENLLTTWVKNAIKKFGISKIVISGGVAMNIKAMGKIAELYEVSDIFIGGSASDESMAISSGICLAEDITKQNNKEWSSEKLYPIDNLYLGSKATFEEEKEAVSELDINSFDVLEKFSNKEIAKLLANGKILARSVDKMEFGQRALGNRSILADPKDLRTKEKINQAIKNRDFWMPFAPVILDKYVDKYLYNNKNIFSPYMTVGFETTEEGYEAMISACHPADKTARPEMLSKHINPKLYELLEEFEELTGRGALLNTSFNLHGYPIVRTPQEAIYVLKNSELDGIILNNYLVLRR
ncbi:putative carbamoyl transferase, NodU family [Thiovulum sp. ES]|nr:putative carbamoyl transferase, NodU family [Thiovulum sp. ES]